jgi:hypothetical protein
MRRMEDKDQNKENQPPKVEMIGDVKVIRFEWDEEDEWSEAYKTFKKAGRIRGCGR